MERENFWEYGTILKRLQTDYGGRDAATALFLAASDIHLEVEKELIDRRRDGWVADCDTSESGLLRENRISFQVVGFRRNTVRVDQYCVPIKREIKQK